MHLTIIGAESLGVRSLCCLITLSDRRIVIDPGISLGYSRHGLMPHPLQVAVGRTIRKRIVNALATATDIVFSHFHGDHIPLADANPYQLSIEDLPKRARKLPCWSKLEESPSAEMRRRFMDLTKVFGGNLRVAEGASEGPLAFSRAVSHGAPQSRLGTVMMTRVESGGRVFVHASDIQLLDDCAVDRILAWHPTVVLAAGPPLYLARLGEASRKRAWNNAIRLAQNVHVVILDHHVMRNAQGVEWLNKVSAAVGKRVYCVADFMGRPKRLLEMKRTQLYAEMPVPSGWHARYAVGETSIQAYFDPESVKLLHC